jgi:hypothetical protein
LPPNVTSLNFKTGRGLSRIILILRTKRKTGLDPNFLVRSDDIDSKLVVFVLS